MLLLGVLAPSAPAAERDGGTTVRVIVTTRATEGGRIPVPGVEVFLFAGGVNYACTNRNGIAIFDGVPAGNAVSATGIANPDRLEANPWFLHPESGAAMLVRWYKGGSGGEGGMGGFTVPDGGVFTARVTVRTPRAQGRVCGAEWATDVLTAGDDDVDFSDSEGKQVIIARAGNDTIDAGPGDDIICGNAGFDEIDGGPGNDTIFGGNGNDTLIGGDDMDLINGGARTDTCVGEVVRECEA